MKKKSVDDGHFQKKHRTEWRGFLWDNLLQKLTETNSKKQTGRILNSLFSNYEKKIVVKRLAALALIRSGIGTREIIRVLWMSPATVSALKKSLFTNPEVYKSQRSFAPRIKSKTAKILIKESWLEDLFGDIDIWELLKNSPRPTGTGLKRGIKMF